MNQLTSPSYSATILREMLSPFMSRWDSELGLCQLVDLVLSSSLQILGDTPFYSTSSGRFLVAQSTVYGLGSQGHFMDQDACSSSNHHDCIPANEKEEREGEGHAIFI